MKLISPNKTLLKTAFALVMISFLFIGIFGVSYHMGVMNTANGSASGCLFAGGMKLCTMNIFEHIYSWQSMFRVSPLLRGISGMILFAVSLAFVLFWLVFNYKFINKALVRFKLYLYRHFEIQFFSPLKEAFSKGILNPKIYSLAL